MNTKGGLTEVRKNQMEAKQASQNVATLFNSMLSREGYQKRFNELLGKRAPQFIGSLVSMINDEPRMIQAFYDSPNSIIKAALRAASYDLPIDPTLGQAYVVPFKNKGKMEAVFILGYKGMYQLAVRTGVYKRINVVDVHEGELVKWDRLTEEAEFKFVDDDEEREKLPIIGYCGYFELTNGMKKTIYMTKEQIENHEKKFRKGDYMGKVWKEDWESMAAKTVLRRLLGKWGLLSVNYQNADEGTVRAAEAIASGKLDDADNPVYVNTIDAEAVPQNVDPETGEVISPNEPTDEELFNT